MSSKAFPARTSHTTSNPQLCGLHEQSSCLTPITEIDSNGDEIEEEVAGAIIKKEVCFYLTCRGDQAQPNQQIQSSKKADGYDKGVATNGATLRNDIPNYTDIKPVRQFSEILDQ